MLPGKAAGPAEERTGLAGIRDGRVCDGAFGRVLVGAPGRINAPAAMTEGGGGEKCAQPANKPAIAGRQNFQMDRHRMRITLFPAPRRPIFRAAPRRSLEHKYPVNTKPRRGHFDLRV
jgi:hypothetical protein